MSKLINELENINLADDIKRDFDINEAKSLIQLLCAAAFIKSVLSLFSSNPNLHSLRLEYETRSEYDDNSNYETSVIHRATAKDESGKDIRYLKHDQSILDLDIDENHEEYRLEDCDDIPEEVKALAQGAEWVFGIEANDSPLSDSYVDSDEMKALFGPFPSITLTREAVTPFLKDGYTLGELNTMLSKQNSYDGITNKTRIEK